MDVLNQLLNTMAQMVSGPATLPWQYLSGHAGPLLRPIPQNSVWQSFSSKAVDGFRSPSRRDYRARPGPGNVKHAVVKSCTLSVPSTRVVLDTARRPPKPWWYKDKELWEDVHTEKELRAAVGTDDHRELVVVDWFGTFCLGCRQSATHLASLASDPEMTARCKFVRACADKMVNVARREGARAIPYIVVYTREGRKIVGFSAAASKHDTWRANIRTILRKGGAAQFYVDDRGMVRSGTQEAEFVVRTTHTSCQLGSV